MIIYRIEDNKGFGVYTSDCCPVWLDSFTDMEEIHPPPENDSGMSEKWCSLSEGEKDAFIFGFESVKQLRTWFYNNPRLKKLDDKFILTIWEIASEHAIIGNTQAAFRESEAEIMSSHSITEFFNL